MQSTFKNKVTHHTTQKYFIFEQKNMRPFDLEKLCKEYQIEETELAACLLFIQTENKTFSCANTIYKRRKVKWLQQSATGFFKRDDIQLFIKKEKHNFSTAYADTIDKEEEEIKDSKKQRNISAQISTVENSDSIELTRENIKSVMENELSKTKDPEKRTALLIKIADFLSLNNNVSEDIEKPVIYLPDRNQATA